MDEVGDYEEKIKIVARSFGCCMKKLTAYICETDYNHEFDPDNADLPQFYSTVKSLKKDRSCWRECGIVEVEVRVKLIKSVRKGKL